MGLEFIDISREEEGERARANGTTGRRRAPGGGRPRQIREGTSRTVSYENQRARRSERPRQVSVQAQNRRQTRTESQGRYSEPEKLRREYNANNRVGANNCVDANNHISDNSRRSNYNSTHYSSDGRVRKENRSRNNSSNRNRYGNSSQEHSRNYNYNGSQVRNERRRPRPVDPRARQERIRRRKIQKRKAVAARMVVLLVLLFVIILAGFLFYKLIVDFTKRKEPQQTFNSYTPTVERREVIKANETNKPIITEDFLTVNEYSRPGEKLGKVKNIFVHYTANPGTSAAQNRSYFENLGITGETSASAHFVIGYDGEIIQCIPLDEIAYAVIQRNYDSISIECCYLSEDGKFTDATYQSLLRLSAWLLKEYKLAPDDMRRHYDEGGKKCPLYYVEHEEAWEKFLSDLEQYIMNNQV